MLDTNHREIRGRDNNASTFLRGMSKNMLGVINQDVEDGCPSEEEKDKSEKGAIYQGMY